MLKEILKRFIPPRARVVIRSYFKWWMGIWMYGLKCECPCCGSRVRRFLAAGVEARHRAQCPRCGCFERHRLLFLYLKNRTTLFEERYRLLDISPRYWIQKKFLSMKNLDYISADLFDPVAMVKADITALPFQDNEFDCVLCYSVFECVEDDIQGMKEILRVLKPGGWALIHVYVDWSRGKTFEDSRVSSPKDREKSFGGKFNCRIYGADYLDRLKLAGFDVDCIDFLSSLTKEEIERYGLHNVRYVFHCKKTERTVT